MKLVTGIQIVAGIALAAAGMYLFQREIDIQVMLARVRATPLWALIMVIALQPATLFLRSVRWAIILPNRPEVRKKELFPFVAIGFMINNFVPARAGEAIRAALLWKRNRFTFAESAGSIVVERLLDIIVFSVFLVVPLMELPQLAAFRRYGYILSACSIAAITAGTVYAFSPATIRYFGNSVLRYVPLHFRGTIARIGRETISNCTWLSSLKSCITVILLSFVTLACQIAMFAVLGFSTEGFSLLISMFATGCAAIGAAIPFTPGYVGTLHATLKGGLIQAGINGEMAGTIAVLYHAIGYIVISLMGLFYFFRLRISIDELRKMDRDSKTQQHSA